MVWVIGAIGGKTPFMLTEDGDSTPETALDYRLSPGVVFPASTLDAVSAYFYLTEGASDSLRASLDERSWT